MSEDNQKFIEISETETKDLISKSFEENGKTITKTEKVEVFKQTMYTEPKMLIVDELVADLKSNSDEMSEYIKSATDANYKCNYIYIYSLFEGALWQLASSILYAFPEKIKSQDEKVKFGYDTNICLDGSEIISSLIEEKLRLMSTGNLSEFLKEILRIADIAIKYDKDQLYLISIERNAIVHTNTTKKYDRTNTSKTPQFITKKVADSYEKILLKVLEEIKIAISHKYQNYTRKKLLEDAWNYTVGGYLKFSDLIGFDKAAFSNSTIARPKFDQIESALKGFCSTEKTMLFIWMSQYSSNFYKHDIMREICDIKPLAWLDRKKLNFLVNLFNRFPYLMDGQDYSKDIKENK